jgi:hypothetical protein
MSDVLLVYVRDDAERADALADLCEGVGYTVDGFSDDALSTCAAAIIVWSPAAGASPRFREATTRAVQAGKAIVASFFILPPPFARGAPFANLRGWSGESEHTALDPLFLELDARVTNAKRAAAPVNRTAAVPAIARFAMPSIPMNAAALHPSVAALVLVAGVLVSAMSIGPSAATVKFASASPNAVPFATVTATAAEMERAPIYIPEPSDVVDPVRVSQGREPASAQPSYRRASPQDAVASPVASTRTAETLAL